MNALLYTLLAYAIGLGALWGYAAMMWHESRSLDRRSKTAWRD